MAANSSTILAIDDDALLLSSVVEVLEQAGYTVLQAKNGKEGFEMALKHHPDLIITDNLMPLLNGVDMIAGIRKDPWGKKVPVIIMTNMYTADMLNRSLAAGGTDYVMKSDISINKIVDLVRGRLKD